MIIDKIGELDLNTFTLDDIAVKSRTGRGYKNKPYRNGVVTSVGDVEKSVWLQMAAVLLEREGLVGELENMKEDLRRTCPQLYAGRWGAEDLNTTALEYCVCRIFDNPRWVGFVKYNRKYRPEVLKQANLVTIIPACCQVQGETTAEQIEAAYNGTVACPHCGRFSEFTVVGDKILVNLEDYF